MNGARHVYGRVHAIDTGGLGDVRMWGNQPTTFPEPAKRTRVQEK